jgi:integrase
MNTLADNEVARLRVLPDDTPVSAAQAGDWPAFWQRVQERLRRDGYRPGTLRLYRQVLRDLRDFLRDRHGIRHPASLTRALADAYLSYLAEQNVSWSWLANVIAVLRNCFDRLGDMDLTAGMVTPRRKWPLPETLHARELRLLFDALPNPRDRLLVALLAGCGLRVSEACRVRWADLDAKAATLRIEDPSRLRSRTVPVPQGLLPLLQGLAAISRSSAPMVCGRSDAKGTPRGLSVRQAERVIQKAGLRSGVLKRVTPTNLRSTYAHRRLLAGHNIREVQVAMGHRSVKTTLRYQACILPNVTSPLDPESQGMVVRQMNVLLGRLAMTLPALSWSNGSAIRPTKPRGP